MCSRACCATIKLSTSYARSWNSLLSQDNFMLFSLYIVSSGIEPKRWSHKRWTAISSSVIIVSPSGRCNVCVSILHLSTKAVIKWSLYGLVWGTTQIQHDELSFCSHQVYPCASRNKLHVVEGEVIFRYLPKLFCWSRNRDMSAGKRWLYVIAIQTSRWEKLVKGVHVFKRGCK